ncbi:MAG: hypothetical protein PUA61_05080 [Succinatimonas hippei]|nr:hypothetical protein [Succinatimonas hippei]
MELAFNPDEIARQFKYDVFRKYKISIPDDDPLFLEVELLASFAEKLSQTFQFNIDSVTPRLGQAADEFNKRQNEQLESFSKRCAELSESMHKELEQRFHDAMLLALNEAYERAQNSSLSKIGEMLQEREKHATRLFAATMGFQTLIVIGFICFLLFY